MKVTAIGIFGTSNEIVSVDPLLLNTVPEIPSIAITPNTQAVRNIVDTDLNVLLPKEIAGAIELDLLDCNVVHALITGVLRGTNVKEFLERLGVLACTGTYPDFICCRSFFMKCFRKGLGEYSRPQPILFDASAGLLQ